MDIREARQVTGRTLEEIEALAAEATPGPWALNECSGGAELMLLGGPSRKYVASIRIHQVPRHMGEWEERKRTKTAELLEALPDLLAIAQGQSEEIERLKARYAWIDSGFGDLDFHREEAKHKGPKRGCKASYYWMRIGVKMVTGGRRLVKSDDAKDAEPVADGIHSPYFDDDWRG